MFGEFFGTEVRVFAVSSGTAANSLALATFCPPWGTVLTHAEAHIERDECGAPEFFTGGAKLSLVGGAGAKILPPDLAARLDWFEPHVHGVQPRMLSITQATERGAIYTPQEIRALAKIAHERDMAVHVDGARFANALVAQNVYAGRAHLEGGRRRAVVWRHQEWRHECRGRGVLRSDPGRGLRVPSQARRATALQGTIRRSAASRLPRKWYVAAQRRESQPARGTHRRRGAALLSEPLATNQVFMKLGEERIAALSKEFGFYPWGPAGSGEARFVCSWDTPEEDVDALCAALAKLQ